MQAMSSGHRHFAQRLRHNAGPMNPSQFPRVGAAGGGMMSKFVGVFRELASFNELLHTQVELILVERLHRNWLKVQSLFT